jgi:hypothetical protein
MMATEAYWSGRKVYWDAKNEAIVDTAPAQGNRLATDFNG